MNDFFKDALKLIITFDIDAVIFNVFFFRLVYKSNWKRYLTSTLQLLDANRAVTAHEVFRLHMLCSSINMLQNTEIFWEQISILFNQLFLQIIPT